MALMDREYVRAAPRWHLGESAGASRHDVQPAAGLSKGQWLDRMATAPPQQQAAAGARSGSWFAVCVLIALVGIGLFFWGAFSQGAIPAWLTWSALGVGLLFGLGANGLKEDSQRGLEAERHAQIVEAIARR